MKRYSILLVGNNHWLLKALHLLLETEPEFCVKAICDLENTITLSQRIRPDMILFLPAISFISCQQILSKLHTILPRAFLMFITPVEAALYEGSGSDEQYQFISQNQLAADLIPRIWTHFRKFQDGTYDHARIS